LAPQTIEEYLVRELANENVETIRKYLQRLDKNEIVRLLDKFLEKDEVKIPLSIFSENKLGSLEAIVKYLRENLSLSNTETSRILNRSPQSCWATYRKASEKHQERLKSTPSRHDFPVRILTTDLSVLESIVMWLSRELTLHQIAQILGKDDRTIWTVKKRAKAKIDGNKG